MDGGNSGSNSKQSRQRSGSSSWSWSWSWSWSSWSWGSQRRSETCRRLAQKDNRGRVTPQGARVHGAKAMLHLQQ
jgi:hypothetical protein